MSRILSRLAAALSLLLTMVLLGGAVGLTTLLQHVPTGNPGEYVLCDIEPGPNGQCLPFLTLNNVTHQITIGASLLSIFKVPPGVIDASTALSGILPRWLAPWAAPLDSPAFLGTPSLTTSSGAAQLSFVRFGNGVTYVGASLSLAGISTSENLPLCLYNFTYGHQICQEPAFGNVGIDLYGTPATAKLDINGQADRLRQSFTPTSSSQACDVGQHGWDLNFEYRCVATNTWRRASLAPF